MSTTVDEPIGRRKRPRSCTEAKSQEAKKYAIQYHCDYCRKDISNCIRIKCVQCTDFDLCVECFSVGVEIHSHKAVHDYHVMERMDFPLFAKDWSADEELLLLEALKKYGIGNWSHIGEHVVTKTGQQCQEHYFESYINSSTYPLPDMTKSFPADATKHNLRRREEYALTKVKKPKEEAPKFKPSQPILETGYMPKRKEFETEWLNNAEVMMGDFCIDKDDPHRELKLQVLEMYNQKLDERLTKRKFAIDNDMVDPKKIQQEERKRSKEEKVLWNQMAPFLQLCSLEEQKLFLKGLNAEESILKRIMQLKEYRSMGLRTLEEAKLYDIDKRRREDEKYSRSKWRGGGLEDDLNPKSRKASLLDISTAPSYELLSENERQLCSVIRLYPKQYLTIKDTILKEYMQKGHIKRATARSLIKIDVNKTSRVFDFMEKCKWINMNNKR